MRFNPRARVDQSEVDDVGGSGGGGGGQMGLPIPSGGRMSAGTLVLLIIVFVVIKLISGGGGGGASQANTCKTGADANKSDKCAAELFTTSVQDYWERTYPAQTNGTYQPIKTVLFSGQTSSACGTAASQMGPFYCPNDKRVYLDSTFFHDMLQGQLGAKGGTFSIGYVIAHEYGHHIEDQLGLLGKIRTQKGPSSDSVKAELMADCLGGMWAKGAQETKDANGTTIIQGLTQDDINRAIDAAQAVGDDRIQKKTSGRVDPEQWTHGSAAERKKWFGIGVQQGSLKACNTFEAASL
jgi:hypothetical protein